MLLLLLVAFGQRALAANAAPTLTNVSTLTGSSQAAFGSEDNDIFISYAVLKSAADEADVDGGAIDFMIGTTISSGTLMIRTGSGGSGAPAAGQKFSSSQDLIWRPAANVSGDAVQAFTIRAIDSDGGLSAAEIPVTVKVGPVNDAPTVSTIALLTGAAGIALGNEDSPIVVRYAALLAAADEADIDSPTINFQITSISGGTTLTIRAAGSLVAGTSALSQILDSTKELVWTPSANANGDLSAFSVKAIDGSGVPSSGTVPATIRVAPVSDLPVLTTITTFSNGSEDTDFIIRHAAVAGNADESDADNIGAIDFKVVGGITGTMGVRTLNAVTAPTPVVGTVILTALNELVWRPATNANGVLTACTMVAHTSDGDSATPVELKVQVTPVNDLVVVTSAILPVQYSLNINGFSILLPGGLTIADPDGQPVLVSGSNLLTITCAVSLNRVANQDQLVVRNTAECLVNTLDNGSWEIYSRASSTVKIAIASVSAGNLIITLQPGAETLATGATPPTRSAILGWVLQSIAYTNNAGLFATNQTGKRQATLTIREAGTPTDANPITVDIDLLSSNEPPTGVKFADLSVSPGNSGVLAFSASNGTVKQFDDHTSNDDLEFTVLSGPGSGRLIDLSIPSHPTVLSFFGRRLNPLHPQYAGGIAYENINPNVGADGVDFQVTDAATIPLTAKANLAVLISFGTNEARIISDPLLVIHGSAAVPHPLKIAGPTGSIVQFAISALPRFANAQSVTLPAAPANTTTDSNGSATASLIITPPAGTDYLAFLLTCTVGNSTTKQPFIIRLMPSVVPLNANN